jgi:hypothetical protein
VGQQQPKIAVFAPGSQAGREAEDNRVMAWVHRALRKKQQRLARAADDDAAAAAAAAAEERPSVSLSVRRLPLPSLCRRAALSKARLLHTP